MNSVGPVTVVIPAKVVIPETLNWLVNSVGPVTVVIPANVEIPDILSELKSLGASCIADSIVAVVVASREAIFWSCLAELRTCVASIERLLVVVTPVTNTSPITVSFDVGFVVPMPTLPLNSLLPSTYKRWFVGISSTSLVFPIETAPKRTSLVKPSKKNPFAFAAVPKPTPNSEIVTYSPSVVADPTWIESCGFVVPMPINPPIIALLVTSISKKVDIPTVRFKFPSPAGNISVPSEFSISDFPP